MASLEQSVKKTPSLAQIATLIKNKAVALAPKKTGNLKRQLDTYNRPAGMVKKTMKGKKSISLSFTLDVSPPGAEYGKYWNDPNVSKSVRKGKTTNVPGSINFSDKAINDPQIQQLINKAIEDITNDIVETFKAEVKDM